MPFADVAALALPAHATVAPVAATPWETVTVRPGDTLWDLAIAHRSTIQAIVEKNQLSGGGALIQPGQKLLVPGRASSGPRPRRLRRPHDSRRSRRRRRGTPPTSCVPATRWARIAQRYGVSLTKLLSANKLSSSSIIYVGQKVTVPRCGVLDQAEHTGTHPDSPVGLPVPQQDRSGRRREQGETRREGRAQPQRHHGHDPRDGDPPRRGPQAGARHRLARVRMLPARRVLHRRRRRHAAHARRRDVGLRSSRVARSTATTRRTTSPAAS